MVYGKFTVCPAPGQFMPPCQDEVVTSVDCFLYSNLSPAHCIGEKWKVPGPQTMAPLSLSSFETRTFAPSTASLHSYDGWPAASLKSARQTFTCGPHLAVMLASLRSEAAVADEATARRTMAENFIVQREYL